MYKSYILSNVIFIEIGCNGMDILILKYLIGQKFLVTADIFKTHQYPVYILNLDWPLVIRLPETDVNTRYEQDLKYVNVKKTN